MSEKDLLEEFSKTLENSAHKKYVESYCAGKEKGLSEKFDALIKDEIK